MRRGLLAGLAIVLLLAGCVPAPTRDGGSSAPSGGGTAPSGPKTLRIAMQSANEQAMIAPYGGSGAGSAELEHYFMFHSNLTVFDPQRTIVPRMATKIPSIDDGDWKVLPTGGMEVTWKLRPNLFWHDGTPLHAEDFVFGFQVVRDPDLTVTPRGDLTNIQEVQAPDANTVVVVWKGQSIFGNANGNDGVPILPRHILRDLYLTSDKATFENSPFLNTQWVGLGPYRMTQWERGSHIEATAFDRYFEGRAKIDRLIIRYIGDVNALVANVLSGEIDVVPAGAQLDIGQMVALRQAWTPVGGGQTLLNPKSVRTLYLQFRDPNVPWARDVRVRQALLHSLNRDEIVESLLSGLTFRADYYIPREEALFAAAERGLPKYPFDMARAERLLGESGWTRGPDRTFRNNTGTPFAIDVMASGQGDNVTEAVTVAGQWSAAGFQSVPNPYPAAAENAPEIRHNMKGALIWPWNFSTNDPRTITAPEIGSDRNRWRGGNYGGYLNASYEALYDRLSGELDIARREDVRLQMLKIMAEELPVLPLFYRATGLAARKGVEGPTSTPPIQSASTWNIAAWDVK